MQYLGWFILGMLLSVISVKSIDRTITQLSRYRSARLLWSRYLYRLLIAGLGLLVAVQWGTKQLLAVFIGILIFRWFLLVPKFYYYFYKR